MRYTVDLISRYQSAFGFVGGTLVGELEGLANGAIFKAGIAYNEARWEAKKLGRKEPKYDANLYAPADWHWAEMTLTHEDTKLNYRWTDIGNGGGVCSSSTDAIQKNKEYHCNGGGRWR